VPTNHTGVSRYNQQTDETGFFLEDINSDTLIDQFNSATIRSLALGNKTTVTVKGGTKNVRGFVVCTSNDTHDFLAEEVIENYNNNDKNYYNAWRRRFITVKFTSAVDENPMPVRFDYTSATDALKCFFNLCYNLLQDQDVKNMFNKYYVAIMHSLSPDCIENLGPQNLIFQHL
jgi:hypothetical protein